MTSRNFSTASNQLQEEEVNEANEYAVLAGAVLTAGVSSTPPHHESVSAEGVLCSSSDSSRTTIFLSF
jgi:hypothetical protein